MISHLRLALSFACLLALSLAGQAAAHASLVESDPPDRGSIERTPATLTAVFDEQLDRSSSRIVVRNIADEEVALGGVSDDDLVMTVDLPPLPPGEYRARWTAVTPDDGAVTRGTIRFTIEQPPTTPTPAPIATPTAGAPSPSPTRTAGATATRAPTASPPPPATPATSPPPDESEPVAGVSDVLLALVLAGAAIGGLSIYLLRRR